MENAVENTAATVAETPEKRKPRKLKGTDIFLMTSIIGKIGIRNLMGCFDMREKQEEMAANGDENAEAVGQFIFFAMLDVVMDKLEKAETPICKLLANLYGMDEEEVREIGAGEYLDMFIDVVMDENFVDFFRQAYESVKRMM